jgi:hypothetical protein
MLSSDIHLVLDTALYSRQGFQTRNRILGAQGEVWLSVPVHGKKVPPLDKLMVDKQTNWSARHWRTIMTTYGKARTAQLDWIRDLKHERFADVAWISLQHLTALLGIEIPILHASELRPDTADQDADQRLLDLMATVGGTEYVSGIHGHDYMDLTRWHDAGVNVTFCHWTSLPYPQETPDDFVPNLSIIDLIARLGPSAATGLIKEGTALQAAAQGPRIGTG